MPVAPAQATANADFLVTMADRCVQCGLCLPYCPTYQLDQTEAESPRGRIAYVKALATGLLEPTAIGDRHLDNCLGCRRCETACPADVPYEALLTEARRQQRSRQPLPMASRILLALLARPRLLNGLFRLYAGVYPFLPKRLRALPRPGPMSRPVTAMGSPNGVAMFIGCVAGAYESGVRVDLVRLLAAVGVQARIPPGQTCCGNAARHAGQAAQAASLADGNQRAFAGSDQVLTLASGCEDSVRQSLAGASRVTDALEFLAGRADRLRFRSAQGRRVALHLPCSQRVNRSDSALRLLLDQVPDLNLVPLPDFGCCGAAGLHMLAEPERAARLRAPLLDALADSGATELLSANIGCRLHLGNGSVLPVRHPIEFLAEQLA